MIKRLSSLFLFFVCFFSWGQEETRPFITKWKVTAGQTVFIQLNPTFSYDFSYVWKDTSGLVVGSGAHRSADGTFNTTLASSGAYTLEILGDFPHFQRYSLALLEDVLQWGDIVWRSFRSSFQGWQGATFTASDVPDMSIVTQLTSMFQGAINFNANLNTWDVSNVIHMRSMFQGAGNFNSNLSNWNVSRVRDMRSMFQGASAFNSDLSPWNIRSLGLNNNIFVKNGADNMFDNSGLSSDNYDHLLSAWGSLSGLEQDLKLGVAGISYCDGLEGRNR